MTKQPLMETEYQLCQNPAKSPFKSKKIPVITRGEYYKVRVRSYGAKKICCWLGRQIKTEKARKTGKADKDREGKKDREGRRAVTVQRISYKYIKSVLWTVTVPVSVQPC